MRRGAGKGGEIPPTLTPLRAIELLKRQLDRGVELRSASYNDPRVAAWENQTAEILTGAFGTSDGEPHRDTREFKYAHRGPLHVDMQPHELLANHIATQELRQALLESYIEQLDDLAPPASVVADGRYRFHPTIERVSGQLFRDGHYQQAVLTAYIEVIHTVKTQSGLALDGDSLMNRAFGCENQTPIISFNALQTAADRDEQKGFMYLFKGLVALRNSKAHVNRLINDAVRAQEYLGISSVLIRMLEIAQTDP
jgi:uncharacterized protein (TIGR02391 family)